MIEIIIFKILLNNNIYNKYYKYIFNINNREHKIMFSVLENLHSTLNRNITFSEFKASCLQQEAKLEDLLNLMEKEEIGEDAAENIVRQYCDRQWSYQLAVTAMQVSEGQLPLYKIQEVYDTYSVLQQGTNYDRYKISDDYASLFSEIDRTGGIKWRLPWLNKNIGGLHKGDFGFIFARTNIGKSTFIASEISYMLLQIQKPCCFFFNEEAGSRMKFRVFQAFFGVEIDKIKANFPKYQESFNKNTKNLFHFYDMSIINKHEVEAICKEMTPDLIVIDNIDKIHGFKADREDLKLGSIYTWAREIAKTYSPFLAVCQANGSAENKKWLQHTDIKDAHTAKSSEADFILGIGTNSETGYEDVRYLRVLKNKFIPGEQRCELKIDPLKARYYEI